VSFQLLSFKLSSGCLFIPHHVNQGPVQKPTPQVTLYEPHTAEDSFRRRRSGRHSQVPPDHPGQARELRGLHVLLPPHQRVCVKGHLLHCRVGIQLGLHTVDISTPFFVIRLPLTLRTKYYVLLFDFSKRLLLVRVARDFSLTDCPPACWVALAFLPASPSPRLPFARFVCLAGITTVSRTPRFFTSCSLEKKELENNYVFLSIFFLVF